jgi:hypothetical protein
MGIACRAAALSGQHLPGWALHLLFGSALVVGVVQSLSDPGVVFLKLTAGLEVVPKRLLLGGQLLRHFSAAKRSMRTFRPRSMRSVSAFESTRGRLEAH